MGCTKGSNNLSHSQLITFSAMIMRYYVEFTKMEFFHWLCLLLWQTGVRQRANEIHHRWELHADMMNAADEYKSSAALSAAECGLISVNNEND